MTPLLLLALLHGPAQGPDNRDVDPPGRVARLAYISGSVSFRPGDVDDWTDASVNYPLEAGDHLWADTDARAEISIGATAIRLDQLTAFGILALDDRTAQFRLSQGSIDVRLRRLGDREVFEIDTPNGAVTLERPGTYRVDVDSTGDTTVVTVRGGAAEVTASGSAFSVDAGQVGVLTGTDAPSYDITSAGPPDDWERWCASRDRRWDESRSTQYVSPDMVGYEDLDGYGDWRDDSPYGPVWVPRDVDAGWAPYRYGHWAWVEPWGWTWVDDAAWGFAPFHYGRWVWFDGRWAWVPGRPVARPVYAPALVVFVGGPRWSMAMGAGGGVAWFPLGPDEVYVPAYRASPTYVRNVNVTNVNVTNINVTNIDVTTIHYRNREAPGGVTSVSEETFVDARPIGRNRVDVPRERLADAVVVGTAAPLAPTRVSVLARPTAGQVPRPPERVFERRVVVKSTPPPAPLPFSVTEPVLRAQPGRPLDQSAWARLRAGMATPPPAAPVKPAVPANGNAPALRPAHSGLPAPHRPPPTGVLVPNPTPPPNNAPAVGPPRNPANVPPSNNAPAVGPPRNPANVPPTNNAPVVAPPRNPDRGRARPDTTAPHGQERPDRDKGRPGATNTPPGKKPAPKPKRGESGDTTKTKP